MVELERSKYFWLVFSAHQHPVQTTPDKSAFATRALPNLLASGSCNTGQAMMPMLAAARRLRGAFSLEAMSPTHIVGSYCINTLRARFSVKYTATTLLSDQLMCTSRSLGRRKRQLRRTAFWCAHDLTVRHLLSSSIPGHYACHPHVTSHAETSHPNGGSREEET